MHRKFVTSVSILIYRPTEHVPEDILPAFLVSLKDLQLDYLDLYLMHWPVYLRKGYVPGQLTDEDKLGYDPDKVPKVWTVSSTCIENQLCLTMLAIL